MLTGAGRVVTGGEACPWDPLWDTRLATPKDGGFTAHPSLHPGDPQKRELF